MNQPKSDDIAAALLQCMKYPGVAVPLGEGSLLWATLCSPKELQHQVFGAMPETLSAGHDFKRAETGSWRRPSAQGQFRDPKTGKVDLAAIFQAEARASGVTSKPNI